MATLGAESEDVVIAMISPTTNPLSSLSTSGISSQATPSISMVYLSALSVKPSSTIMPKEVSCLSHGIHVTSLQGETHGTLPAIVSFEPYCPRGHAISSSHKPWIISLLLLPHSVPKRQHLFLFSSVPGMSKTAHGSGGVLQVVRPRNTKHCIISPTTTLRRVYPNNCFGPTRLTLASTTPPIGSITRATNMLTS